MREERVGATVQSAQPKRRVIAASPSCLGGGAWETAVRDPLLADALCATDKGGLPVAPAARKRFAAQLKELVANAYPAIE